MRNRITGTFTPQTPNSIVVVGAFGTQKHGILSPTWQEKLWQPLDHAQDWPMLADHFTGLLLRNLLQVTIFWGNHISYYICVLW